MSAYDPRPEHKFTFGLWTVGHQGRDPFGEPTRDALDPIDTVHRLAGIGAAGVSLHDNDLVPFGASLAERDRLVKAFGQALEQTGLFVGMATTNLFTHPAFKEGAFTANDRSVRRFAIQKAMRSIDIAAELGAQTYVFWGGREGAEIFAAKRATQIWERSKEALDFLCAYVKDQGYDMRFALEPKPNEPRGDSYVATVGHALALIAELEQPDMVGLNPEVAHETMVGLSFNQAVSMALWAEKLFHIDLNAQRIGRYDQDFRFGQEDLKETFLLVRMLQNAGYDGARHFDAHALRTEDTEGVWDFARGCMRTYLILAEKARSFDADPRVQEALSAAGEPELAEPSVGPYSAEAAEALKAEHFDPDALGRRRVAFEALDQLVVEHLLGA